MCDLQVFSKPAYNVRQFQELKIVELKTPEYKKNIHISVCSMHACICVC